MQHFIEVLLKACLFLFVISLLAGLYFLYTGSPAYIKAAEIGILSAAVFTIILIGEVLATGKMKPFTKFTWIMAFIIFQVLAGIAYYLDDRKTLNRKVEAA